MAKLPAIPRLVTGDKALASWSAAVTEHLEVRQGIRGKSEDAAVTRAELDAALAKAAPVNQYVENGDSTIPVSTSAAPIDSEAFRRAVREEIRAAAPPDRKEADAALLARIRQVEAKSGSGGSLVSRSLRVSQHPNSAGNPELQPNVVFFNGVTMEQFALDYYRRLYSAETPIKVDLTADSMFFNGFTVQQWAEWTFEQLADRNNRIIALEQRSANLESYANYLEATLASAWGAIQDLQARVAALEAAP